MDIRNFFGGGKITAKPSSNHPSPSNKTKGKEADADRVESPHFSDKGKPGKRTNKVKDSEEEVVAQDPPRMAKLPAKKRKQKKAESSSSGSSSSDSSDDEVSTNKKRKSKDGKSPSAKKKAIVEPKNNESVEILKPAVSSRKEVTVSAYFSSEADLAGKKTFKKSQLMKARKEAEASIKQAEAIEVEHETASAGNHKDKLRKQQEDEDASLALALSLQEEREEKAPVSNKAKKEDASLAFAFSLQEEDEVEEIVPVPSKVKKEKASPKKKVSPQKAKEKVDEKSVPKAKEKESEQSEPSNSPKKASEAKAVKKRKLPDDSKSESSGSKKNVPEGMKKRKLPDKVFKAEDSAADESADEPKLKKKPSFWELKNRGPPPALGSKEVPEGAPNCLGGLAFVFTGVLESLEREQAADIVKKYGGRVTGQVSGKTDYLVMGNEAGESKKAKAEAKGVKVISEDDLLEMIRTRPSHKPSEKEKQAHEKKQAAAAKKLEKAKTPEERKQEEIIRKETESKRVSLGASEADLMWVDKYAPIASDQVIGNPGNVAKVKNFLLTWHTKAKANPDTKKALFIHGPPGIGKTTCAHLVARLCGFEVKEFNASDVRNKKELKDIVGEVTQRHSINKFFLHGGEEKAAGIGQSREGKTCVIMDEIDGMSGNADRGGLQEMKELIVASNVPIICVANDGGAKKLTTLKKYCEDIIWQRPRNEQIIPRLQEIAKKENLQIDRASLEKICDMTNKDIRQALHFMQMLAKSGDSTSLADVKERLETCSKDETLNAFSVVPRLFSRPPQGKVDFHTKQPWIHQHADFHFIDSSLMPLFVQDMYLKARPLAIQPGPASPEVQSIQCYSLAADSISDGDLIYEAMMKAQNYSLMPMHAIAATVAPGWYTGGGLSQRIFFPSWFGKNSTINKKNRQLFDIRIALSLDATGTNQDFALDYLPLMKVKMALPMIQGGKDGAEEVSRFLEEYGLTREDWDTIMDIVNIPNPLLDGKSVDSSAKRHFTKVVKDAGAKVKVVRHEKDFKASSARVRAPKADEEGVEVDDEDVESDEDEEKPTSESQSSSSKKEKGTSKGKKEKGASKGKKEKGTSKSKKEKKKHYYFSRRSLLEAWCLPTAVTCLMHCTTLEPSEDSAPG
eukprot:g23963.t1